MFKSMIVNVLYIVSAVALSALPSGAQETKTAPAPSLVLEAQGEVIWDRPTQIYRATEDVVVTYGQGAEQWIVKTQTLEAQHAKGNPQALQTLVASGGVEVIQGDMTLRAPRLDVSLTNRLLDRVETSGGWLKITRPDPENPGEIETLTADRGVYDISKNLITMIGNVEIISGGSRLSGERAVYNTKTRVSQIFAPAVGDADAKGEREGRASGRVRLEFNPQ